jgi:hypothetical protein
LETLTKTYKPRNRNMKACDGSVVTDGKGILNKWNEHFRGEKGAQPFEFYENESHDYINEEIEEPTLHKIQEIIRNLKRMKMPGTDNINLSNAKLNHICHLLALFGAHHILHVSR